MQDKRKDFEAFDSEFVLINEKGKKLYPKYVYSTVKKYLSKKDVTTIDKKKPSRFAPYFCHTFNE